MITSPIMAGLSSGLDSSSLPLTSLPAGEARPARGQSRSRSRSPSPPPEPTAQEMGYSDGPMQRQRYIDDGILVPAELLRGRPTPLFWHDSPPTLRLLGNEKRVFEEWREERGEKRAPTRRASPAGRLEER
jgi:hypothetical protein